MPKVKISEYSATANSNTDVASINIDEGCAPSGINNAIRAVMGHLKDFQQGTNGDPFNGPVNGTLGATTASTANVTTLTTSSTVTHNGGTINGVAYLNGAKVLTTGSALTFDGSKLLVSSSGEQFKLLSSGDFTSTGSGYIRWYDSVGSKGYLGYIGTANTMQLSTGGSGFNLNLQATGSIIFEASAAERMRLTSTSLYTASTINVGIGTSSPLGLLNIKGSNGQLVLNNGASSGGVRLSAFTNAGTANGYLAFEGYSSEYGRFDASGNLLVGTTTGSNHYIAKAVAEGADILGILSSTTNLQSAYFMGVSSAGENAAAAAIGVRKNVTTSRSINAGGTINASGADYAEYMTKAGNFTVAKGDVVGIDANGKLTNVFADSVSFMVKSTDPSYVGGDTWGSVDVLGQRPNDDATQEVKDAFYSALEAARQLVDRIAFAGQVPVNVIGATAGQYIIPVNNNGAIKGEAFNEADMTLSQYMKAVGKVIAIESDGRAKIIVKVA